MKIVLVTDDHQTISAHFGRAQFYEIFTIEVGRVTARETIARVFPQVDTAGGDHESDLAHPHDLLGKSHDHNTMIGPISDCQALITRGMGMGAHLSLKEHGIQPIITDIHEIQVAVDAYLAGTLVDHPEKLH